MSADLETVKRLVRLIRANLIAGTSEDAIAELVFATQLQQDKQYDTLRDVPTDANVAYDKDGDKYLRSPENPDHWRMASCFGIPRDRSIAFDFEPSRNHDIHYPFTLTRGQNRKEEG